ncbi:hypothetical protein G9A89_010869 [Geosiphon pyriformis]|nr:hypothetical protein G9A89_010869 [Geosiphon pyriformis]
MTFYPFPNDSSLITSDASLRRALNRHTKDTLLEYVEQWLQLPETYPITRTDEKLALGDEENEGNNYEENLRKSLWRPYAKLKHSGFKKQVIDRQHNGLNFLQVAQLDMKCLYIYIIITNSQGSISLNVLIYKMDTDYRDHSSTINWTAFKLCSEPNAIKKEFSSVQKFKTILSKQILTFFINASKFAIHVYVELQENNIWTRISIFDGIPINSLPPNSSIIYLVYFMKSEYIICGNIKPEHKKYFLQGISRTFGCEQIQELHLKGENVESLRELLLCSSSQESHNHPKLEVLRTLKKTTCHDFLYNDLR